MTLIRMFCPYVPPSLRHFEPLRAIAASDRLAVPFVYDLVAALRPSLVVDLVSAGGGSFFAACQSLRDHDVDGVVYAVDEWTADSDGGTGGEDLAAHARQFHMGRAYCVSMSPEAFAAHCAPASVELLIVGAARAAIAPAHLREWMRRVSGRGALLVRDIDGPTGGRLWNSVVRDHDGSRLELGDVGIALGNNAPDESRLCRLIRTAAEHPPLRQLYAHIATHHELRAQTRSDAFVGSKNARAGRHRKA